MATFSNLLNSLTNLQDHPMLDPQVITAEAPEQSHPYDLIHNPLSGKDDGIFKSANHPLCILAANNELIHFYGDTESDPLWQLSILDGSLILKNAGTDVLTINSIENMGEEQGTRPSLIHVSLKNKLETENIVSSLLAEIEADSEGTGVAAIYGRAYARFYAGPKYGLYGQASGDYGNIIGTFGEAKGGDDLSHNYGVYGKAISGSCENIGVYGNGLNYGVYGDACSDGYFGTSERCGVFGKAGNNNDPATNYGIKGYANAKDSKNYGVFCQAEGENSKNYGIYAQASGGISNWAGYFDGNTFINKLIIGTEPIENSNNGGLLINWKHKGNSSTSLRINNFNDGTTGRMWINSPTFGFYSGIGSNNDYKVAILGEAVGDTNDAKHGVYGISSGKQGLKYAVYGQAEGTGLRNYGVYGQARGASNNYGVYGKAFTTKDWAGYFEGKAHCTGGWSGPLADYGGLFESSSGKKIDLGTTVVFADNGKIRPAKKGEIPFGIITKNSAFVGNSYNEWPGKYLKDEFGNVITEEAEEDVTEDFGAMPPETNEIKETFKNKAKEKTLKPKLNPQYDESKPYIPRDKRKEWNLVGLLGQLCLRKGQPVAPTWVKIKDISDDVELWLVK